MFVFLLIARSCSSSDENKIFEVRYLLQVSWLTHTHKKKHYLKGDEAEQYPQFKNMLKLSTSKELFF